MIDLNKSFDEFLEYLDEHKEEYFDLSNNQNYKFSFSLLDEKSIENCLIEIAKMNNQNTMNLLRMYHEWLSKQP